LEWTRARFNSFIKSALRAASNRYPPKFECKKAARIERGIYLCAGYKTKPHKVPATLPPPPGKKRRVDNAVVDHVIPVGGPDDPGGWNGVIERMFCGAERLQVLCHECHSRKTADERTQRKKVN
jgi:hypothetical protein